MTKEKMLKKIILFALVVTSAVCAQIYVGARVAANWGSSWGEDAKEATWEPGFNAGVAAKVDILPLITIVSGLDVDYRRMGAEEDFSEGYNNFHRNQIQRLWYLDVPVLARFNIIPLVYVDAGFVFGLNLSSDLYYEETGTSMKTGHSEKVSDDLDYSRITNTLVWGVSVGAGFSVLPSVMDVDFRIIMGLNSYMKEDDEGYDTTVRHLHMQLGVAFWFL